MMVFARLARSVSITDAICVYRTAAKITSYGSSGFSAVTTGIRLTDMRGENVSLIRSPFVCSSSAQLPWASRAASFPARNRFLARLQPSTPAPYTKIFM